MAKYLCIDNANLGNVLKDESFIEDSFDVLEITDSEHEELIKIINSYALSYYGKDKIGQNKNVNLVMKIIRSVTEKYADSLFFAFDLKTYTYYIATTKAKLDYNLPKKGKFVYLSKEQYLNIISYFIERVEIVYSLDISLLSKYKKLFNLNKEFKKLIHNL